MVHPSVVSERGGTNQIYDVLLMFGTYDMHEQNQQMPSQ